MLAHFQHFPRATRRPREGSEKVRQVQIMYVRSVPHTRRRYHLSVGRPAGPLGSGGRTWALVYRLKRAAATAATRAINMACACCL